MFLTAIELAFSELNHFFSSSFGYEHDTLTTFISEHAEKRMKIYRIQSNSTEHSCYFFFFGEVMCCILDCP